MCFSGGNVFHRGCLPRAAVRHIVPSAAPYQQRRDGFRTLSRTSRTNWQPLQARGFGEKRRQRPSVGRLLSWNFAELQLLMVEWSDLMEWSEWTLVWRCRPDQRHTDWVFNHRVKLHFVVRTMLWNHSLVFPFVFSFNGLKNLFFGLESFQDRWKWILVQFWSCFCNVCFSSSLRLLLIEATVGGFVGSVLKGSLKYWGNFASASSCDL